MSWFKVDDNFAQHEKVLRIPRATRAEAIGTWTLAGTWSARQRRDGHVPEVTVEEVGGTLAGAEALVAVKLWRRTRTGYLFVNWSEFQPTREQDEERRRKEREKKARQRANAADRVPEDEGDSPLDEDQEGPSSPDIPGLRPALSPGDTIGTGIPTRPDPTRSPTETDRPTPEPSDVDREGARARDSQVDGPVDNFEVGRIVEALMGVAPDVDPDFPDVLTERARVAARTILSRSKGKITNPTKYVVGSIRREPDRWARFATEGVLT